MTFAEGSQLREIGERAFWNTVIAEVQIPASVQSIGKSAFYECENLQKVTFTEGSQLKEIGKDAFLWTSLTEIEIPASV